MYGCSVYTISGQFVLVIYFAAYFGDLVDYHCGFLQPTGCVNVLCPYFHDLDQQNARIKKSIKYIKKSALKAYNVC